MSESSQSERQRLSIVALGSFNPAIFHPVWFARHELIREIEASAAEVRVVSPQVSVIECEWFTLQVTTERFQLETRDPRKCLPMRDLASATFSILEHTPVTAFGFNSHQWFQLDSTAGWHQFGHHFAPKKSWSDILDKPGLVKLTLQGTRFGSSADRIQIAVQPAGDLDNGVVISVNEHYAVKEPPNNEFASANVFVETLARAWSGFQDYAQSVSEHLLREGKLAQ